MNKIYKHIELLLGVDARSLGVFRIFIGAIILYDLFIRSHSIEAHYTDYGIVSRHILKGISENPLLLSFNMLSGDLFLQVVIFFTTGIAAFCLMVGFKSQLSSVVCLMLMLSIQVRNPFVNNLGDWFLLHLLFWGSLLPLGLRFSIDSRVQPENKGGLTPRILSIATLGILVQIASLYFFSVFRKISPIWHTEGTAIHYALSLDRLVTDIGEWVLTFPYEWLTGLTATTLFLERWGPILLFVPLFIVPIRIVLVLSFILFHFGLALTLKLGIFPFVCISAWLLLIPSAFWDNFFGMLQRNKGKGSSKKLHIPDNKSANDTLTMGFGLNVMLSSLLLLVVVSSNLLYAEKMSVAYYDGVYRYVEPLINSLNLRQRWNMFSPHPAKQDGWILIIGVRPDGTMIDLEKEGKRVDWTRPADISATYYNQRWRKYMEYVSRKWDPHAKLLGTYYLKHWNSMENDKISKVIVCFMAEYARGPYDSSPVHKRLLVEVQLDEEGAY